jgi:hypothetical protein
VGNQYRAGISRGEEVGLKRILIVGVLLLAIFVAVFRQRIFVRDPLGKVERNGIAQDARVYINYSNDVLVEEPAAERRYLVQGWSGLPGSPKHLVCLTGLVCWTDADEAAVFPLEGVGGKTRAEMSAKEVTFVDEIGASVRVGLR